MGDYFCQTCVIYFCLRCSCCPYYWGVCKARADCTYFGSGKREAFKQDMFISMHLLLLSGGGEAKYGGTPYYGPYKETLLIKRLSIFLRLEVFHP